MFRTTYGIRQTGDIDGGIEIDFHHIGVQLLLDGVIYLGFGYGPVMEDRQARYQHIALGGDDLHPCSGKLQLADIGVDGYQVFRRYGGKVAFRAGSHFQDQLAVQIPVIGTLHIRYLRDDAFALVDIRIAERQPVFPHRQFVPLLVLQQGIGIIGRRTVDTPLMASEISTAKTSSRVSKLYMAAATTQRMPFMTDSLESLANSASSSLRVAFRNGLVVYFLDRTAHSTV